MLDIYIKVTRRNRSKRIRKIQSQNEKYFILPLAGNLCVFSETFNVYRDALAHLDRTLPEYNDLILYRMQYGWHRYRREIGIIPPTDGWPMKVVLACIDFATLYVTVYKGIQRIYYEKHKNSLVSSSKQSRRLKSLSTASAFMKSEIFDADANTIIVDNSANCII